MSGKWDNPWKWSPDIVPPSERYRENYDKIDWGKPTTRKEPNPTCIACGHSKASHKEEPWIVDRRPLSGCRGDQGECLCKGYVYCGEYDGCDEQRCSYPGEENCRVKPRDR